MHVWQKKENVAEVEMTYKRSSLRRKNEIKAWTTNVD